MTRLLSFALVLFLCSCNSGSSSSKNADTTAAATTATTVPHTWNKDDEQQFMNSCIESSKARLGDTAAFAYCKCVLGKVQAQFPTLDSSAAILQDSAQAAKITAGCK